MLKKLERWYQIMIKQKSDCRLPKVLVQKVGDVAYVFINLNEEECSETDDEGNVFFDNNLITEKKLSEYYAEDSLYIYNDGVCPLLPKNNLFYLSLAVGYNKVRDTALVEVIDISFEIAKDNSGNEVRFNIDDSGNVVFAPDGKLCVWIAVLHLGNIVEKNIVSK